MFIKKIILFVNISILFSCVNDNNMIFDEYHTSTIDIRDLEKHKVNNLPVKDVDYIPLETNENCMIGQIDKIIIKNDRIFILDKKFAKSLFVFDITGKFLFKVGSSGRGPSEYISMMSFDIDSIGNLYLNDNASKKIIKFNRNGLYLKYYRYENYSGEFAFLQEEKFILSKLNRPQTKASKDNTLLFWNSEINKIEQSFSPSPGGIIEIYGGNTRINRSGNNLNIMFPCNSTLYRVTNNKIIPYYKLMFNRPSAPFDELSSLNQDQAREYYEDGKFGINPFDFYENEKFLAFIIPFHKKNPQSYCLYSKKTGQTILAEVFNKNKKKDDFIGQIYLKGTYNDKFISVIQGKSLNYYIKDANENNKFFLDKYGHIDVVDTLKYMTEGSNPIVVLYNFEDF